MKDAKGHGSNAGAHSAGIGKVPDVDAAHRAMLHAVTEYDRKQEARATKAGPKGYYNPYALPQYLGGVSRVHDDIKNGVPVAEAINNHLNGQLARTVHKALKTGGTDIDTMRRQSAGWKR